MNDVAGAPLESPEVKKVMSHGVEREVTELMQQRMQQLVVHSVIYYRFDSSIIPDSKWDEWALELVGLMSKYPNEAKKVWLYSWFKDFDGCTGYHLAGNPWGVTKALQLLKYHREHGGKI